MNSIDEYINKTYTMKNISNGGSPAYSFGDVILIKYSMSKRYGVSRPNEENVAKLVNKKNEQGVRTPKHLSIKRVIDGDKDICWVLQEAAKGENFTYYCDNKPDIQLKRQKELSEISDSHYEQLIHDLSELINLGIETKPKNLFYDNNQETGGFTIIDLLGGNNKSFDSDSLKDVLEVWENLYNLFYNTRINYFTVCTEEQRNESEQLGLKITQRLFNAMEKAIPNFDKHKRWILRTFNTETLKYFSKNNVSFDNLRLDENEEELFNEMSAKIIADSILKIQNGECKYWEIEINIIRNELILNAMEDAWLYHHSNNKRIEDYSSLYNYKSACSQELQSILMLTFDKKLEELSHNTTNKNIITAKKDMDTVHKKKFIDEERDTHELL